MTTKQPALVEEPADLALAATHLLRALLDGASGSDLAAGGARVMVDFAEQVIIVSGFDAADTRTPAVAIPFDAKNEDSFGVPGVPVSAAMFPSDGKAH